MTDLFESPRTRLRWAQGGLAEMQVQFRNYLKSTPDKVLIEMDANGVDYWHKMKLEKFPDRFNELMVAIVENLRSALDQTGYAAAVASGVADPKKAYFPICKDASQFENTIKQNCADIPSDIQTLFRNFKGHPGGDELLIALNVLCGVSKHRIIRPMVQGVGGAFYKNLTFSGGPFKLPPPRWDPVKNEIKLFAVGKDTKVQYDMNISIFIAFGEIEFVAGKPMVPILNALVDKVRTVIDATEAESRRIGLIS